eukprot:TRINITY_DN6596_c0_g3_i1.p1 TRINITY_DN6596_c0_g3~~TRINITY_DN6596_c0_g3_i1.p1  ORF type:complete len:328 (+),score=110.92 TRINITY_DN6596_c0_g3_i1:27-986(+)
MAAGAAAAPAAAAAGGGGADSSLLQGAAQLALASPRWEALYGKAHEREKRMEERRREAAERERSWIEKHSVHREASAAAAAAADGAAAPAASCFEKLNAQANERERRMEELRRQALDKEMESMQSRPVLTAKASPARRRGAAEELSGAAGAAAEAADAKGVSAAGGQPCWEHLYKIASERQQRLEEKRRLKQEEERLWLEENNVHRAAAAVADGATLAAERQRRLEKLSGDAADRQKKLEEQRRLRAEEEQRWLEKHSVHRQLVPSGEGAPKEQLATPRWAQLHDQANERAAKTEAKRRQRQEEERRWLKENSVHNNGL